MQVLTDGPYSQMDKKQLRARIWSDLRSSSYSYSYSYSNSSSGRRAPAPTTASNFSLRITLEAEANLRSPQLRVQD